MPYAPTTSPAGPVEVFVTRGLNPSSSTGMPNSASCGQGQQQSEQGQRIFNLRQQTSGADTCAGDKVHQQQNAQRA